MNKKAAYWLKQLFQTACIVFIVSLAVDWWRKPAEPPAFAGQQLAVLGGGATTLAEFSRNRTAVVYFWGSWCGICKHTTPVVQRLHKAGVPVLGVALQSGSDEEVQAYMRAQNMDFRTVNDPQGGISRQWRVAVTPTFVLVKNGAAVHSTTGLGSYWGLLARVRLADVFY